MLLYDVLEEVAGRQMLKTDTGDNRILGVVVGVVTKNYDENMPGRVCVRIPVRDEEANELKWARLAMLSGGKSWGHYFVPEVGDQVLVAFEQGNIERPYVIGCLYKDNDKMLTTNVDEKNQFKSIVTKNGSLIRFTDGVEDEEGGGGSPGEKDKIEVITSGKEHSIIIDNENDLIHIKDKEGKNQIKMRTEADKGNILISTEQKLTIKVGDKVTLTMNGSTGTVTLETDKFIVQASDSVNLDANSKMNLHAATVSSQADATLKLESGGATIISGVPIKLG